MTVADRVLDGLGPAYRAAAGALLDDLVAGLTSQLERVDELVQPTASGWAAVFDLDATPQPRWLGAATGTKVPGGLTTDQQRAFVRDRSAWRRGTVDAMAAAVRTLLTGGKHVWIDERFEADAWHVAIRVYAPDATGLTEDQILAAAATQKAYGLVLDSVSYEAAVTYDDLSELYADYEDAETDWTAYPFTPELDVPGARWWRPAATVTRYARLSAEAPTYSAFTAAYPTYRDARDHDPQEV